MSYYDTLRALWWYCNCYRTKLKVSKHLGLVPGNRKSVTSCLLGLHSRVPSPQPCFFFSALFHNLKSSILTLQAVSLTLVLPLFVWDKLPADTACFQTWSPLFVLYLALCITFPLLIHKDIYFDAELAFIFLNITIIANVFRVQKQVKQRSLMYHFDRKSFIYVFILYSQ